MSQRNETGFDLVIASEAVVAFRAFTWGTTTDTAGYCGAGGRVDGFFEQDAASAGKVTGRLTSAPGTFKAMVAGACSPGDNLFSAASGKLSTTAAGSAQFVALETATADGDIIEVQKIDAGVGSGLLYAAVAASTAISNTTTPTDFSLSHTIPANALKAGDVIRIKGQGIATATNSTDTLAIDVEFGGVDILALAAVDVADNDIFQFEMDVEIRTIGAAGTLVAHGQAPVIGAAGTATVRPRFKASTAIDTTAALLVVAEATWSVASASNSCRLDAFTVELLRK